MTHDGYRTLLGHSPVARWAITEADGDPRSDRTGAASTGPSPSGDSDSGEDGHTT